MGEAVAKVFVWIGHAIFNPETIGQYIFQAATLIGLNVAIAKWFSPDIKKPNLSLSVTVRNTVEHQRIVYGETLASGPLWYINTAGEHNESLYYAIIVAGHECEDMTEFWVDDNQIPSNHLTWDVNEATVVGGDFAGEQPPGPYVTFFERKLGQYNQSISGLLSAAFPTDISSGHKLLGHAYFVARLDYVEAQAQVWSNGYPTTLAALVKGKKLYDPRSDDTQSFGTGPLRLANSLTWRWSDNPALCWADYMIDNQLGFAEDPDRIEWGYVASAAEWCEQYVYTPVGSEKRYTCNGVLHTADEHHINIRKILSSMNGTVCLENGTWKVRPWSYETPTLQFSDADLRKDMEISFYLAERERYNTVRAVFIDKDRLWKDSNAPPLTSAEYIIRDNSEELIKDISLHMTKSSYEAQRIEAGILEKSDRQLTVKFPSNFKTLPAEINGTIALTYDKMGWDDKVFRVERFKFEDLAGIDLYLREDDADVYSDVGTAEYATLTPSGYILNDPGVPAPSSFWAVNRVEAIEFNVTPPAARLYEFIEIVGNTISNSRDQATVFTRFRGDQHLYPTSVNTDHYFWARAQNIEGEYSDYIPNSDQTNVVINPSTAISVANVDTAQWIAIPDQGSGWANAGLIPGLQVHGGGRAPIKVDVSLEVTIISSPSGDAVDDYLRMRWRRTRGGDTTGFGAERVFFVPAPDGSTYTFKGLYETQVNTLDTIEALFLATHPSSLETFHQINHWSMTAKVIPDATAGESTGPSDITNKTVFDFIDANDNVNINRAKKVVYPDDLEVWDSVDARVPYNIELSGTSGSPKLASDYQGYPDTAYAGWGWWPNGSMSRQQQSWSDWNPSPDEWIDPNQTPDETFYIKFTVQSYDNPTSYSHTLGTYMALTNSAYFRVQHFEPVGNNTRTTVRVDISTVGSDGGIVATGYYSALGQTDY